MDSLPSASTGLPALRRFGDASATRSMLFDRVLQEAKQIPQQSNQRYTLEVADVGYTGPENVSRSERKRAVLEGRTISRRLQGTWRLRDNTTGEVVDERRKTLANVPYPGDEGTFINNGHEYTLAHQQRLRPGVFARIADNGEIESHVNVRPGTGTSHRIYLDPSTGVFRVRAGQARIPLMPLMRALGVSDGELREAWGNDLTAANIQRDNPAALNKLYQKLVGGDPNVGEEQKRQALTNALRQMELDPEVSQRTLGQPFTNMDRDTLLAVTRKLLAINRGEADPDDRDHQAYQQLLGPEEVFAERIRKGMGRIRQALWKATNKGDLRSMPSGVFDESIQAALLSSGLGQAVEEINPTEILDQQTRVTRMGEGGIRSIDAVPEEARNVQPSQLGFIDLIRTPESAKVGVDLRLARAARKGADGRLYTQVRDAKGNSVWKSPQDLADSVVALPGEMEDDSPTVTALVGGKPQVVKRERVEYTLPSMEDTFSPLANLVPMKSAVKAQRAVMASRMFAQALPLRKPEAPLVQSALPEDHSRSFEEAHGRDLGAIYADDNLRVVDVTDDEIVVKDKDGKQRKVELYNNHPYNLKTRIHNTPAVRPGDVVKKGQLLAKSNFTTPEGTAALGVNARVAYLPYEGSNFEDAVVISEGMADKLTSEHLYQHRLEAEENISPSRNKFMSIFPSKLTKAELEKYDEDGVIKPGAEVKEGDPLILAVKRRESARNRLHRGRKRAFADASVLWEHHSPGVVTDVAKTRKGMSVVVRGREKMGVGDKLSGRYGDKGIISKIVPDEQMPRDTQGRPFEVLLNPLGVISRGNPAQIIEAALGKIAEKTGKPVKVPDFDIKRDLARWALEELQKHGLSDTEDIVDPEAERKIGGVMTGNRFFMKLHHTAESKGQAREFGSYTAEQTPAKGGKAGSKRVGMLEIGALLSHGATDVIRDAKLIRGQENPEYWQQLMSGHKPPTPKIPHVYEKFVNQLRAAGINVVRDGTASHIMAMTDKDIDHLAGNRELKNADTVQWHNKLKPVKGGLFDERLTGGHNGKKWSRITLATPLPNPAMEEPIRRILGLTKNKLKDIIAGRESLYGGTGPQALARALDNINLDHEIERARQDIAGSKRTARDAAIRRLGYLKDAKRLGIHPRDWMINKVPVLPPAFRPVSVMGANKLPLVADPNYLYSELFDANETLKSLSEQVDDVGEERETLYESLKGVVGLGDPVRPQNRERRVRGLLKHIFGKSPKLGTVQRRLLGGSTDLVGRAVISPNPELDMDHVGLPEEKAWEVYKPFVVRNLVKRGVRKSKAVRAVKERSKAAREELVKEMGRRPVVVNRAPTLHRYGMMAFRPRLTKGDTLQVSPLIVAPFAADFNGDSCRTPLLPVLVQGNMFLGDFESFIQEHVMPDYREEDALELFGKQTTVFEFAEDADVRVPGIDENGDVSWRAVSHISIHTSHGPKCYQVKTARGLDAVFTAHHNFVTLDEGCRFVPTKTGDVSEGSLLPMVFNLDTEQPGTVAHGKPSLPLTYHTGFFLGHWLGDGSLSGRDDTVSQAGCGVRLLEYLEDNGAHFTGVRAWYEGNRKSVRWTDKKFFEWLREQFGKAAGGKRIPGWCMTAPREFREGIFAGFIVAEGSIGDRSVRAESVNRPLLLSLQMLASSIGIPTTIRPSKPARKSQKTDARLSPAFVLHVNIKQMVANIRQWPDCEHKDRFSKYTRDGSRQVWDRVPYPPSVSAVVDAHTRSFVGGKGRWASTKGKRKSALRSKQYVPAKGRRAAAERGYCTRAMARKIIQQYDLQDLDNAVIDRWIAIVENEHLLWDMIETVDPTDRPEITYDFHVPGGETFCVDGFFLTHNTMQYHVPADDDAVDEAYQKMLPSRNLFSAADFGVEYKPSQEYVGGLWAASAIIDKARKARYYRKAADAIRAYRRGEIGVGQQVVIQEDDD